ncbi:MAG: nucleotidyl transferase AbiEii/AbiGii toxin family protein [Gammaproteobacteria bacterium]|jgi:predicted nucleotidyltransferase component of viral defense system
MGKYTPQQYIEQFHLLFLSQLSKKLDQKLYAIKGGCNLRFYFKSIRYSEDLDLDIRIIHKDTLHNKITRILESQQFSQLLRLREMVISNISMPKQTETTQRWKILLKTSASDLPLHTKIEFSRRKKQFSAETEFQPIDAEIIQSYKFMPILANHYTAEFAYCQKVKALADRSETQARDIFDIYILLHTKIPISSLNRSLKTYLDRAKNNALSISFADFKSQTVAYLMADHQNQYDSQDIWDNILLTVVTALGAK